MSDPVIEPGEPTITLGAGGGDNGDGKPKPKTNEPPDWLGPRLERERANVLKQLGVDSIDDAKKAIEEIKARQEAEKTVAQKATELEAKLKAETASKEALVKSLGAYAATAMSGLTEAQKNAVSAVAGDDPALQLKTIEALRPTWASAAVPAATEAVVVNTSATASMPKDGQVQPPPEPKAIYQELKKTNPVFAARYASANGVFPD